MNNMSKTAGEVLGEPKEERQAIGTSRNSLIIGIPKEIVFQENRIALTPLSVALLVEHGHQVIIETQAGAASNFMDHHYSEQGAQIVYEREAVFKADIIIKIASPTLEEVDLMKTKQILLSSQQPTLLERSILQAMIKKQITALSYEYLKDEGGHLTVVRAMSEIVGATSILIA